MTADDSFDIADKLPPLARERFRSFENARADASAAMRARYESITALTEERRDVEAHLRTLRGSPHFPGTAAGLAEDSPQLRGPSKRLEKLKEIIERERAIETARGAAWESAAGIARACRDWITSGVPRNCEIADHPPIDASALVKKSESLLDTVERVRRRGRELSADLHRTRCAPHPSLERKAAAKRQVDTWAEAGAPNLSGTVQLGGDIEFPTVNRQVDVRATNERTLGFFAETSVVQTLAWLFPGPLIAAWSAK